MAFTRKELTKFLYELEVLVIETHKQEEKKHDEEKRGVRL